MEGLRFLIVFGFLAFNSGAQNTPGPAQSPSYLIAVSRVVRPYIPTTVSITVLTHSPVTVVSEIIHGNVSVGKSQSTIGGGSTGMQVLPPIPERDLNYWYPYELVVKGYADGALIFTNSTMLHYNPKSMSILLQTDKSRYKPGQAVKIRAVVITPDGKPRDSQIDVTIMDPRGNVIRQWLSVDTVLGTASIEFQLSQSPPLGMWRIVALIHEVVQYTQFLVDLYVPPKFEVLVDAPTVLYYKDQLTYTVTARYFYGKPVAGILSVTYIHGFYGFNMHYEERTVINGVADLNFDLPALYRVKRSDNYLYPYNGGFESGDYINITVQVTDQLTYVTHNTSVKVSIAMLRYKLEFEQYPPFIKPSLTFSAQLRLSTYDNQPLNLEDQSKTVTLTVTQQTRSPWTFGWDDTGKLQPRDLNSSQPTPDYSTTDFPYPFGNIPVEKLQLPVSADGVIPFQIQLSEHAATLTLEAYFEDAQNTIQVYRSYTSPSKSYIQLQRSSPPQIGRPLHMSVESNFALTTFYYMVVSRAEIVDTGILSSSSFTLSPDLSWFPSANILVYCISPDGEIINDALDVSFTQALRNNVSLSWGREKAQPGEDVTLFVSVAEADSLVGILVVDKASQDPSRRNDITEKAVIEELASYTTDVSPPFLYGWGMRDPYTTFTMSGITVLTDAQLTPQMFPEFPGEEVQNLSPLQVMQQESDQRRNFPETWVWLDANMGKATTTSFSLSVPDSMTSWVATAFVLSEDLGLGVSAPAELEVFKNFFLSLNLPAYIIRGELLLLEVNLLNYMDMDLEVFVMVDDSSMFEFVTSSGEESSFVGMRTVTVYSQNGTMVLFPIRATQLGLVPISVRATSFHASDSVSQSVLVKPEGIEQSFTQTVLLEFGPSQNIVVRELEFLFPVDVVPGSQSARVFAVGDILGPSISSLDSLIHMPYGCGEQNMINFAPNVYVLQYLSSTGRSDEETRTRALNFMTQGYERELSYQRMDGSFSAFGESDSSGSTWLSAFVLKCFLQARPFIFIDESVLMRTAIWLTAQQGYDGAFLEPGSVIHTELQGGLDGTVSLTAYVLIALLEDTQFNSQFAGQVSEAVNFLTSRLNQGISSNYSLCLVSYALSLANSPSATTALTELMNRAQMKDGVPMWSSPSGGLSDSWQPRSADIEMAAYVLLTLYRQGNIENGFSLMKWLSQQRNHLGGYGSTQDTVIALQALSLYAALSSGKQINLTITVSDLTDTVATFTIDQTNYLLYQSQEIDANENLHIQVVAKGKGFALFQLTVLYNIETQGLSRHRRDAHSQEAFDLTIYVTEFNMYSIYISICFRLFENQGLIQTGMAILEVGLLTGYDLSQNGIPINNLVRRVETSPGKVIIYLDSVTTNEACVDVPTTMEYKVTSMQDAAVVLYDYYEPRRRTMRTYTAASRQEIPFCYMCEGDCSLCEGEYISVYDSIQSSHQHHSLVESLLLALLIILFI